MTMIKAGKTSINPAFVSHMTWEERSYMNASGSSTLVVAMMDGQTLRVPHEAYYLGGTDAYAVEKAILEAHERED